jgi:hypothetical protein
LEDLDNVGKMTASTEQAVIGYLEVDEKATFFT